MRSLARRIIPRDHPYHERNGKSQQHFAHRQHKRYVHGQRHDIAQQNAQQDTDPTSYLSDEDRFDEELCRNAARIRSDGLERTDL